MRYYRVVKCCTNVLLYENIFHYTHKHTRTHRQSTDINTNTPYKYIHYNSRYKPKKEGKKMVTEYIFLRHILYKGIWKENINAYVSSKLDNFALRCFIIYFYIKNIIIITAHRCIIYPLLNLPKKISVLIIHKFGNFIILFSYLQ